MSMNDPMANALSHLLNSEKVAKKTVQLKPLSKMLSKVLEILKNEGYIGNIKVMENNQGNIAEVELLGKVNNCGVIKPRFAIQKDEFEKYEKRFLPARGFGVLMITTNKGILTHTQAKKEGLGGKLIAYCY